MFSSNSKTQLSQCPQLSNVNIRPSSRKLTWKSGGALHFVLVQGTLLFTKLSVWIWTIRSLICKWAQTKSFQLIDSEIVLFFGPSHKKISEPLSFYIRRAQPSHGASRRRSSSNYGLKRIWKIMVKPKSVLVKIQDCKESEKPALVPNSGMHVHTDQQCVDFRPPSAVFGFAHWFFERRRATLAAK